MDTTELLLFCPIVNAAGALLEVHVTLSGLTRPEMVTAPLVPAVVMPFVAAAWATQ